MLGAARHPAAGRQAAPRPALAGGAGPRLALGGARHAAPAAACHHRNHAGEPTAGTLSCAWCGCCYCQYRSGQLSGSTGTCATPTNASFPPHPPLTLSVQLQAGVASGPQALAFVSTGGLQNLAPLERLCLSLIALAAGAELHLPELRRLRKQASGERPFSPTSPGPAWLARTTSTRECTDQV